MQKFQKSMLMAKITLLLMLFKIYVRKIVLFIVKTNYPFLQGMVKHENMSVVMLTIAVLD